MSDSRPQRDGRAGKSLEHAGKTQDEVRLVRWFLPLPAPLPLPDGWTLTEQVADRPEESLALEDVAVTVIIHQVESTAGRTMAMFRAVHGIVAASPGLDGTGALPAERHPGELTATITVIEAITTDGSPEPSASSASAASRTAREDSLMRCLRLVTDLARAYGVTTRTAIALPAYERLPPFVLRYSAPAVRDTIAVGGRRQQRTATAGPWVGPAVVLLEHGNLPDPVPGAEVSPANDAPFGRAMWALRSGDPRFVYQEHFADARRALRLEGAYGQAVVLAVTAAEVLVDWVLALLVWEGKEDIDLGKVFKEGDTLRRLTVELPNRLGGKWSTGTPGRVADWYQHAYRLRHRIVHGGFRPLRGEANAALDATGALERHIMDRVAAKRSSYPRVTLMTVAQEGLRRRGVWSGKIKAFAETRASAEPSWDASFRNWNADLTKIRLEHLNRA